MDLKPDNLPRLYELVEVEQADSAVDEAGRRARQGAEEGLLVRVRSQTSAKGRGGQAWHSPAGGLYAGLVLRPDESPRRASELVLVGVVSLGSAIAEFVQPPAELHYRWPNDLLLHQGKVASVQMQWREDGSEGVEWLVLGAYVNVVVAPGAMGFDAASVQVEGECEATATQLLESFARHFLVWVDRWANEGFEPVRKAWLQRAQGIGDETRITAAGQQHAGRVLDIADDGALLLGRGGAVKRITIREAFIP